MTALFNLGIYDIYANVTVCMCVYRGQDRGEGILWRGGSVACGTRLEGGSGTWGDPAGIGGYVQAYKAALSSLCVHLDPSWKCSHSV